MNALLLRPLLDLVVLLLIHFLEVSIDLGLEHLEVLHLLLNPILVLLCRGGGCLRPNELLPAHHDIFQDLLLVRTDCRLVLPPVASHRSGGRLKHTHVCTRSGRSRSVFLKVFIRVLHLIMDWSLNYCYARLWLFLRFR